MKRFPARALVAGLIVLSLGATSMAQAAPAGELRFQVVNETWQVLADGEIVETHDNALEARAGAGERKQADPSGDIRVRHREEYLAVLREPPVVTTTTSGATTTTALAVTTSSVATSTKTAEPATPGATESTSTSTSTDSASTTVEPSPPPLVFGFDAGRSSADWRRPASNEPYPDPVYGLTVRRLTSADGTRFNRNVYSRRQAENADGRFFFSYHGSATYRVYDSGDGSEIAVLDIHPDAEPQWHPTDPHIVRHTAGSNSYVGDLRLYETDVITGRTTVVADLADQLRSVMPTAVYLSDGAEGTPSSDGNRYAWMVLDRSEKLVGLVTYDLNERRLLGWRTDLTTDERSSLDAISMSPGGGHVVAQFLGATVSYDVQLSNPTTILAGAEHSDTMIGADGNDYYVYVDFIASSPHAGWAVAHNLSTGVKTLLFDLYDDANTSIHFSGRAVDKPGWVVASTYNCKESTPTWSCDKVFAVNIHGGTVVNLAHTYNCGDSYWTETHASVNRSLSRVYFNSDSGSCGIDAEVFRVDVPDLGRSMRVTR